MTTTIKFQIFKLIESDPIENIDSDEIKLKKCFDEVDYETEEIALKAIQNKIEPHEQLIILPVYHYLQK